MKTDRLKVINLRNLVFLVKMVMPSAAIIFLLVFSVTFTVSVFLCLVCCVIQRRHNNKKRRLRRKF